MVTQQDPLFPAKTLEAGILTKPSRSDKMSEEKSKTNFSS
jgi:hypothetical protein